MTDTIDPPAHLVFLDTETTGLALTDDIWEIAAIRREGAEERELHMFVDHDPKKCRQLPDSFRQDHRARFPAGCSNRASTRAEAASEIRAFTAGAHVVGAVPNFDAERIAILIANTLPAHMKPEWHYHLIDVEALAVGHLGARGYKAALPWRSDDLSRAVGVEPPGDGVRHTAMGDARWAMALYDAIVGGG